MCTIYIIIYTLNEFVVFIIVYVLRVSCTRIIIILHNYNIIRGRKKPYIVLVFHVCVKYNIYIIIEFYVCAIPIDLNYVSNRSGTYVWRYEPIGKPIYNKNSQSFSLVCRRKEYYIISYYIRIHRGETVRFLVKCSGEYIV